MQHLLLQPVLLLLTQHPQLQLVLLVVQPFRVVSGQGQQLLLFLLDGKQPLPGPSACLLLLMYWEGGMLLCLILLLLLVLVLLLLLLLLLLLYRLWIQWDTGRYLSIC
jgi:hypothetical protein